uniref:Uncharacterized protein n=1 Tax=Meloidogyne enterolobii TaxID=390850 RepID=A0A6V7XVP4_MELEN|nr:unnamed protein product [Meloidogyne enterolobii]
MEKSFANESLINSAHLHFINGFYEDLRIYVLGTKGTKDKVLNLIGNEEYENFKANFLELANERFQKLLLNQKERVDNYLKMLKIDQKRKKCMRLMVPNI